MNEPCIPIERLARIAALPAGDPERRHLDTCPRCQAVLALVREFESPVQAPPVPNEQDLDARLVATISDLVAPNAEPRAAGSRRDAAAKPRAWFASRPAWAFAALLVTAAGVLWWRAATPPETQMRAASPAANREPYELSVGEPRAVAGGLDLSWAVVPGADRYEVVFFDPSLRVIARIDVGSNVHASLLATSLPAGLKHGDSVGWRVDAFSGGDRLVRSAPRVLVVP